MYINHSVYPDVNEPPDELLSIEAKADYVHRIASAWDFSITPEPETFALFSGWKEVFDASRLKPQSLTTPSRVVWMGRNPSTCGNASSRAVIKELDRLEGREDPYENSV